MKNHLVALVSITAVCVWSFLTTSVSAQLIENSLSGLRSVSYAHGIDFHNLNTSWRITVTNQTELDEYVAQTHILQVVFPGDEAMFPPNQFADGVDCTALSQHEICLFPSSGTTLPAGDYNSLEYTPTTIVTEDGAQTVTINANLQNAGEQGHELYLIDHSFYDELREKGVPSLRVLAVAADGEITTVGSTELVVRGDEGYVYDSLEAVYVPNVGVVLTYDMFPVRIDGRILPEPMASPNTLIRKGNTDQFHPITHAFEEPLDSGIVTSIDLIQVENDILYNWPSPYTNTTDFSTLFPNQTIDRDVSAGEMIYYQLNWFYDGGISDGGQTYTYTRRAGYGDMISITIPISATSLPTAELIDASFRVEKVDAMYVVEWETVTEGGVDQFGIGYSFAGSGYVMVSPVITTIVAVGSDDTGASYAVPIEESDTSFDRAWFGTSPETAHIDTFQLYRMDDGYPVLVANAAAPEPIPLTVSLNDVGTMAHSVWVMLIAMVLGVVTAVTTLNPLTKTSDFS